MAIHSFILNEKKYLVRINCYKNQDYYDRKEVMLNTHIE